MYVDEGKMRELGFDYDVSNLFAQGETLLREPTRTLATASEDLSYEMNDAALLELENGSVIIIHASSCSCWPDRGGTDIYEGTDAFALIQSFTRNSSKILGEELMSEYRRIV